jgi:hypothetical protein
MKKYLVSALLILAVFLSACGGSAAPDTTAPQATNPPVVVATDPPAPEPTPGPQQYYTENFDGAMDNWTTYFFPPNNAPFTVSPIDKALVTMDGGFLKVELQDVYIGAFTSYDAFEYTDVRLDARIENHGSNTNDYALMCRFSDKGWYEFNVQSDGLWFINYMETTRADGTVKFNSLGDGGTTLIKQDVNEYGMSCIGDTITTYINGEQIKVVKNSALTSGKVAVQVFSLNASPVNLWTDWLTISQP